MGELIAAVLYLSALATLIAGCRGRRIDDRPLCRKCRNDLTGISSNCEKCPKCGRNIAQPEAIRKGNRRHRKRLIAIGFLLLVSAIITTAYIIWLPASGFPIQYKPLIMLRWDLSSTSSTTADQAFAEILSRFKAGQLAEADLAPVIDQFLTWQADPAHRWIPPWSTFIDDCFTRSLISTARWERFLSQSMAVTLHTARQVHPDAYITVWFSPSIPRLSPLPKGLFARPSIEVSLSADFELEGNRRHVENCPLQTPLSPTHITLNSNVIWPQLAIGSHIIHVDYTLILTHSSGGTGTFHGTAALTLEAVPQDTPLVKINHDPAVREALLKAIIIPDTFQTPRAHPFTVAEVQNSFVVFRIANPPIDGDFKLFLVQGDSRWPFEYPIRLRRHVSEAFWGFGLDFNRIPYLLPHSGPAEIVLEPLLPESTPLSPDDPGREVTEVYGDEIRIPIAIMTR